MLLKIYTLKGIKFEDQILSLNLKTVSGEITIMDNHRPLISVLKSGIIKIVNKANKIQEIKLSGGFVEVGAKNVVNILATL